MEHLKTYGSPALVNLAWRLRSRLSSIIDDVWSWETVSESLAVLGKTRQELLAAAAASQCVCNGDWYEYVMSNFRANSIDVRGLCRDVYTAICEGRTPTTPLVVLAGARGGEGKSVCLKALWSVYGSENVFPTPAKSNYPLLDLETKKVAFLDEYRFSAAVLPYAIQCLWFDGSVVPIARPQNVQGVTGHGMYKGTAPVFITTKDQDLKRLEKAAADDPETGLPGSGDASMLLRRLKVYRFTTRVPKPERRLPYCGRCFAQLIVEGGGGDAAQVDWF